MIAWAMRLTFLMQLFNLYLKFLSAFIHGFIGAKVHDLIFIVTENLFTVFY